MGPTGACRAEPGTPSWASEGLPLRLGSVLYLQRQPPEACKHEYVPPTHPRTRLGDIGYMGRWRTRSGPGPEMSGCTCVYEWMSVQIAPSTCHYRLRSSQTVETIDFRKVQE